MTRNILVRVIGVLALLSWMVGLVGVIKSLGVVVVLVLAGLCFSSMLLKFWRNSCGFFRRKLNQVRQGGRAHQRQNWPLKLKEQAKASVALPVELPLLIEQPCRALREAEEIAHAAYQRFYGKF